MYCKVCIPTEDATQLLMPDRHFLQLSLQQGYEVGGENVKYLRGTRVLFLQTLRLTQYFKLENNMRIYLLHFHAVSTLVAFGRGGGHLRVSSRQHLKQFHRIVEGFLINVLCLRQFFPTWKSCKSMRQEELTLKLSSKDSSVLLGNMDDIFYKKPEMFC